MNNMYIVESVRVVHIPEGSAVFPLSDNMTRAAARRTVPYLVAGAVAAATLAARTGAARALASTGMVLFHVGLFDVRCDVVDDAIDRCRHRFGRAPYRRIQGRVFSAAYSGLLQTKRHEPTTERVLRPIMYGSLASNAQELLAPTPLLGDILGHHHQAAPSHTCALATSATNTAPPPSATTGGASLVRELDMDIDSFATHARLESLHLTHGDRTSVDRCNYTQIDAYARHVLMCQRAGVGVLSTPAEQTAARQLWPSHYPAYLQRAEAADRIDRVDACWRQQQPPSQPQLSGGVPMQPARISDQWVYATVASGAAGGVMPTLPSSEALAGDDESDATMMTTTTMQ